MNVNESFAQIGSKLKELGIEAAKDPGLTVNEIIELSQDDDIETLLSKLISYNLYLKSQKGSYEAQLVIKEAELKRRLYLATQNMPKLSPNGSFYSKDEKEAFVVSSDLCSLNEEVLRIKAILARIKDLPYAIDKKIVFLQEKYKNLRAQ